MSRRKMSNTYGTEKGLGYTFSIIGIVLFAIAGFMLYNYIGDTFGSDTVQAVVTEVKDGVDVNGDYEYEVYITYEYEGKVHRNVRYYGDELLILGDSFEMKLSDNKPSDTDSSDSVIAMVILTLMGIAFFAVGFIELKIVRKKVKTREMLKNQGTVIQATVQNVYLDRTLKVNGRCPLKLTCTYTDPYSGRAYAFNSERVWDDLFAMFPKGSQINVYVMPNNFDVYFVDLEGSSGSSQIVDFS